MADGRDASGAAGIELGQFHAQFFDEASDNLARMEQWLLALDPAAPDDETLHAIFRCAHSVKGGAATFGFVDMAELTHRLETLLDRLRRHQLRPTTAIIELLLQAGDGLRAQLQGRRSGVPPVDVAPLLAALGSCEAPADAPTDAHLIPSVAEHEPVGERRLRLTLGPIQDAAAAAGVVALFGEVPGLGRIEADDVGAADGCHHFRLRTPCSDAELIDLIGFHVSAAQVKLAPLPPPVQPPASAADPAAPPGGDPGSLRVPLDKVDALINLAGELVITQAALTQRSAGLQGDAQRRLAPCLADLERHTRQLQAAVMSIRMIPMAVVFSRFPRLLRELGRQLGKKLELVTLGASTELDKGLIEKITDPLMHLVRNSADHGIEPPAERLARGKPEAGTVTLAASHQGDSVVIEVRDDGRGLSRSTLLRKARERGLAAPDSLPDAEVWALILAPGFSTAERVTELSGRGVGLDVVRRSLAELGGTVEIESHAGHGLCVRVRLPLTLAIMDGMSLRAGDECYVLPLSAVVESVPASDARVLALGGAARFVQHRERLLPLLELAVLFDVPAHAPAITQVLVVVESDGQRAALLVDELLGQQQVVVKSLEANFAQVDGVSGATLMGDGRVALILDPAALVRRTTRR